MARSRTLEILITAKDRASKTLRRISSSLKKWGVGAVKIAGAAVAGLGLVTGALTVMFGKLSDAIDEQAKVASSLGVTNQALGVMRDAAGYAGISTDALSTSLKKMSQNVADAANGIGEGKEAIEALGLNAETLQKMKPEKAFTAIITELDKIPNGIKKTGLAMDLFGRSGASMTNLTAKGLQQAQQDADTLGLKLSSAQAAGVEAANDAWERIKVVASDFFKLVTAKLAPSFKTAMDKAFDFIKTVDLEAWAAKAAKGIGVAFQAALVILGGVAEGVIAISRGLAGAVGIVNSLTKDSLEGLLDRNVKDLDKIKEKIKELQALGGSGGQQMRDLLGQKETKENSIRNTLEALKSAKQLEKTVSDISTNLANAQGFTQSKEASAAMQTLNDLVAGLGTESETAADKVEGAEKKKASAADLATEAYNRQFEAARRLNAELLKGGMGSGSLSTVEALNKTLEDGADK